MSRPGLKGLALDQRSLRRWLGLFFLALAIPTGVLVQRAYSQLKWEAFHQHRELAKELATRIDTRFGEIIGAEDRRSFSDFGFLVVAGEPSANFLQPSPLSAYPLQSPLPGLIGYFQVDTEGAFSTPLLPPAGKAQRYGIGTQDLRHRQLLADKLRGLLSRNRLVEGRETPVAGAKADAEDRPTPAREQRPIPVSRQSKPASREPLADLAEQDSPVIEEAMMANKITAPQAQMGFDLLDQTRAPREAARSRVSGALGRVADLKLERRYRPEPAPKAELEMVKKQKQGLAKRARKEQDALPAPALRFPAPVAEFKSAPVPAEPRIHTFESEIDPFELSLLDSGHFVLFRKVWRDGQRYIQGALIDQRAMLQGVIETAFRGTALAHMTDLIVAYRGDVLAAFGAQASRGYLSSTEALRGALLYQTRLSSPLSDMELVFSITRLPAGPGGPVVVWTALTLFLVLCGGFWLMYRLGLRQIALARQQQDFVSAVSHELKTPLTSIRMYSEMLREGWVSEDKRRGYYDYIHAESERLSRLIANLLQLSRMSRNRGQVELRPVTVAELMDGIRSTVASQVQGAGFALRMDCPEELNTKVLRVNSDWFTQVFINLVDNALKFAAKAEVKTIDIHVRGDARRVWFGVRDYGAGVPKGQRKRVFQLFYRGENELTRETVGTGIGLALVRQLTTAMGGQVELVDRDPGVEFRVGFGAAPS